MEQDNEALVDLSPEEAARFLKEKAEEAERRRAEYENTCEQGKKLLESGSYNAAEMAYEKALQLDEEATDASVGYWRAKTADFTNPDVLISEYVDAGIESLEYDLGYEAVDIIRKEYSSAFEKRIAELTAEEEPLRQKVEEKQDARREVLSSRKLRWGVAFVLTIFPVLAAIIATMVVGFKNFSTREGEYIVPTIILACVSVLLFIAFMVVTNKYINAGRMYRLNERLSSTPDGERLVEIMEYKELYEALLVAPVETDDEPHEE
jgi:tetratricopeptide (TPR) repeat protein